MLDKIIEWKPQKLAAAYFWSDILTKIFSLGILIAFMAPGVCLYAACMSNTVLSWTIKLNKGINMLSYITLAYALVTVLLFGFKGLVKKAINISILKDATMSVFKGPFNFTLTKFYLPKTSEWRNIVEPSSTAREIRKMSSKIKIDIEEKNKAQIMDYWHSPFYLKNGMVCDVQLNKSSLEWMAKKGMTLTETKDVIDDK